ncbi:MAG: flagellar hook-associated protein FlgL [Desulfuromonas thiophila]|nr:flagellar hook-associated protein FlgL [Desulfuromonas thiophila]
MKSTLSTTYRSLNAELGRLTSSLEDLRNQAATGKKLLRPSDDPAAIRPVLSARSQIRANDRFISSLSTAVDRLDNQDSYLDQVENLLVSAKEVAINGINGSLSDQDMQTLADQIGYIKTEMLSVANAQVGGQYIFAGFEEDTAPFVTNGDLVNYAGDNHIKRLEASPGEYIQTNLAGSEVFQGLRDTNNDGVMEQTGQDLFALLTDLERALRGEAGQIYSGSTALPNATLGYADAANGDYTPIALNGGDPVALTTSDGQPINLQPVLGMDGQPLTIAEYYAKFSPDTPTDFNGVLLDTAVLDQPMYLHADGSIPAFDSDGKPVITYDSGGGVLQAVSLLNDDGSPLQLRLVPALADLLPELEAAADQSRSARGRMGNNAARLETAKSHLEGVQIDLEQILSRYEDVDMIDVLTEILQTETAFEGALKVTGQVSKLSIMDYL